MDWWDHPAYSKAALKGWVSDALWAKREREKIEWWEAFKAFAGTRVVEDALTADPTLVEFVRKGREEVAARLEEKRDGEVFRVWHFWEVEPGET